MNQTLNFLSKIRFFTGWFYGQTNLLEVFVPTCQNEIGRTFGQPDIFTRQKYADHWNSQGQKLESQRYQRKIRQVFSTVKNQFYILIRLSIALQYESLRKCTFESVSLLATLLLYLTWSRHLKWFISEGIRIWRDSLQNSFISKGIHF